MRNQVNSTSLGYFWVLTSFICSFIFWINQGMSEQVTIERTAMDGSNRSTLIFVTSQIPKSLTLDVAARRLYWISEFKMVGFMYNYWSLIPVLLRSGSRDRFPDEFSPGQIKHLIGPSFYFGYLNSSIQASVNRSLCFPSQLRASEQMVLGATRFGTFFKVVLVKVWQCSMAGSTGQMKRDSGKLLKIYPLQHMISS